MIVVAPGRATLRSYCTETWARTWNSVHVNNCCPTYPMLPPSVGQKYCKPPPHPFELDPTRRARRREMLAFQPSEQSQAEFLRSSWDWGGVLAKSGPSQFHQVGSRGQEGLSYFPHPCPPQWGRRSGLLPASAPLRSDREGVLPTGGRAHPGGGWVGGDPPWVSRSHLAVSERVEERIVWTPPPPTPAGAPPNPPSSLASS